MENSNTRLTVHQVFQQILISSEIKSNLVTFESFRTFETISTRHDLDIQTHKLYRTDTKNFVKISSDLITIKIMHDNSFNELKKNQDSFQKSTLIIPDM